MTPQQELKHKRARHTHTWRPDGLWLSWPPRPLSRAGRLNRDPVQAEGWARGTSKYRADGMGPIVGPPDQQSGPTWRWYGAKHMTRQRGTYKIIKGFAVAIWSVLKPPTVNTGHSKLLLFPLIWKSICVWVDDGYFHFKCHVVQSLKKKCAVQ